MSYQLRSNRRIAKNAKKRFIYTVIFSLFLLYVTIFWILPSVLGGVSLFRKPVPVEKSAAEDATMAPPVLNIPFEATNSAQIDISGYSTPGSKVEIYVNDLVKDSTEVEPDGSFKITDVSLNSGDNKIYGKTVENNKSSLASKIITVTLDNSTPDLIISEPENGKEISGGDKKVTVAGKTEINVKIYVNGGQVIVSKDGSFSTILPLNDGDNTITIKAINAASSTKTEELKVIYKPTENSPSPSPT